MEKNSKRKLYFTFKKILSLLNDLRIYIYIYIYVCVCVCVCVCSWATAFNLSMFD